MTVGRQPKQISLVQIATSSAPVVPISNQIRIQPPLSFDNFMELKASSLKCTIVYYNHESWQYFRIYVTKAQSISFTNVASKPISSLDRSKYEKKKAKGEQEKGAFRSLPRRIVFGAM